MEDFFFLYLVGLFTGPYEHQERYCCLKLSLMFIHTRRQAHDEL